MGELWFAWLATDAFGESIFGRMNAGAYASGAVPC